MTLDQIPLSDLAKAVVERLSPAAADALLRGFESIGASISDEDTPEVWDYLSALALLEVWRTGLLPIPADRTAIDEFIRLHRSVTDKMVANGCRPTSNGTACEDEDSLTVHKYAKEMLDSVLLMQIQAIEE